MCVCVCVCAWGGRGGGGGGGGGGDVTHQPSEPLSACHSVKRSQLPLHSHDSVTGELAVCEVNGCYGYH